MCVSFQTIRDFYVIRVVFAAKYDLSAVSCPDGVKDAVDVLRGTSEGGPTRDDPDRLDEGDCQQQDGHHSVHRTRGGSRHGPNSHLLNVTRLLILLKCLKQFIVQSEFLVVII